MLVFIHVGLDRPLHPRKTLSPGHKRRMLAQTHLQSVYDCEESFVGFANQPKTTN